MSLKVRARVRARVRVRASSRTRVRARASVRRPDTDQVMLAYPLTTQTLLTGNARPEPNYIYEYPLVPYPLASRTPARPEPNYNYIILYILYIRVRIRLT